MKILVILSGGMDSTTMLYKYLAEGHEVEAISFDYQQRHRREIALAVETTSKLNIKHGIVDISFLGIISKSALTDPGHDVPEGHYADENMKQTVVPNRNMIFMSIAAAYALNNKFDAIAIGVHAGDHAIYPDCRSDFIKIMANAFLHCDWEKLELLAPFQDMDKGDIVSLGVSLGVDYSLTQTCYKGMDKPCGKCGSCTEREEAFKKAETDDPLRR